MKKILLLCFTLVLILGQGIPNANAISTISAAGLEWISPTKSIGRSVNDMLGYFNGEHGDYIYLGGEWIKNKGYRFATDVELNSLYDFYGLYEAPLSEWNESNNPIPEWEQFFIDFGITFNGWQSSSSGYYAEQPKLLGFVENTSVVGQYVLAGFAKQHATGTTYQHIDGVLYPEPFENWSYWTVPDQVYANYTGTTFSGSWLIRDTQSVPEPGTLLLLGSGLVGLALFRRRTNKA